MDHRSNVSPTACQSGERRLSSSRHHARKQAEELLEEHRVKMIESAGSPRSAPWRRVATRSISLAVIAVRGTLETSSRVPMRADRYKGSPMMRATPAGSSASFKVARAITRWFWRSLRGTPWPPSSPRPRIVPGTIPLHGVRIEDRCPKIPVIECRPSQICQVILNLLNNSFIRRSLDEKWIHSILSTRKQIGSHHDSGAGFQ